MKKFLIVFLMLFSILSMAQKNRATFTIGYYIPFNLKSGIMWNLEYGYIIDDRFSVSIGGDLYYRTVTNISDLGESEDLGVTIGVGQVMSEWSGWHLPLTAKARAEFGNKIKPFATAGIGYGITHVSSSIYDNNTHTTNSESLTYYGFVWQVGTGALIAIGPRSNVVLCLLYNDAVFDKSEENNIFTVLNSSGIVFRAGVDFAF